jgi:hypothetical protein
MKVPDLFPNLFEYRTTWVKAINEELNLSLLKLAVQYHSAYNTLPNNNNGGVANSKCQACSSRMLRSEFFFSSCQM